MGCEAGRLPAGGSHLKRLELMGEVFSRLTVVRCDGPGIDGAIWWECLCKCGKNTVARGADLKRGFTTSCGCRNREVIANRNRTHGGSATRLYRIWQAMRDRTGNPKNYRYRYYGARGISVCHEWQKFEPFREWALSHAYANDLSIDRIDNDGNYCAYPVDTHTYKCYICAVELIDARASEPSRGGEIDMSDPVEFVYDKWLYVEADTADAARRFFGAPPNWPVKFDHFCSDRPGRVWAVLAEGLVVGGEDR